MNKRLSRFSYSQLLKREYKLQNRMLTAAYRNNFQAHSAAKAEWEAVDAELRRRRGEVYRG